MISRDSSAKKEESFCPESTIDSAKDSVPRRDFIRKAAMVSVGVAVGSTVLGKGLIPESTAASGPAIGSNGSFTLVASSALVVDTAGENNGTNCLRCVNASTSHLLSFGPIKAVECSCGTVSCVIGCSAIGSAKTSCAPNRNGLDFYTGYAKRVSITNCGKVGIGTCTPFSTLCIVGDIHGCYLFGENSTGTAVYGQTNATTEEAAVKGYAGRGFGQGVGVCGESNSPRGIGVRGLNTNSGGIAIQGLAGAAGVVPIVARGASGQIANLEEWQTSCGAVLAALSTSGSLGLGGVKSPSHVLCVSGKGRTSIAFGIATTSCINTTLAVNGSIAAKTRSVTASGSIETTDYAIFASGPATLTLPPAATQNGMMLFVKNVSTSAVSVGPGGTDTIEGASLPVTLSKQYDSLQIISNGSNEWYILSGVKCGALVS